MSKINKKAANKIKTSALSGSALLQMFELLEAQMGTLGAEGQFTQFSFVGDLDDMKPGDLIPELHLSLRPVTSEQIELSKQGFIDG